MEKNIENIIRSGDVLFLMLGAVMVFAMHAGFAFLEVGSVRKKNQVYALVKILSDWSVSTASSTQSLKRLFGGVSQGHCRDG